MKNIKISNEAIVWVVVAVGIGVGIWLLLVSPSAEWGGSVPVASSTPQMGTTSAPVAAAPDALAPVRSAPVKKPSAPSVTLPAKVVGNNSIPYLLGLKEPFICTIETTNLSVRRSGTMYVADGKMRVDFSGYANGLFTKTSMIDDGKYLYVWADGASTGLKLLAASSASGSAIASHGGIDLATPFTFACASWATDARVFAPPTSVSFSNNP